MSAPEPYFDPFAGPAIVATVPTTEPQRELWTASCAGDDASLAFNESVTLRLRGPLDVRALHAALGGLVARHESLRATFTADGLTMVVAAPPDGVPLPFHDWSADASAGSRLRALADQAVAEPFDLATGPLARFALARVAPDDHALLITAHHIVCDGWSFGVIARELGPLYDAAHTGVDALLPRGESFVDHARALDAPDARAAAADAERHWVALLRDVPDPLTLPEDRPRPGLRDHRSAREDRVLPAPLVARLRAAAVRDGVSLFATLLSGFAALVHRLSGQDDLVVGIPTAGQPAAGRPGLVGHLVSMLPLRLRVDGDAEARTLAAQVRGTVLDALEHQALTLGALLARLPIARDPARPPLASVAFNLDQALGPDALRFGGLSAELRSNPRSRETFDLFLNAVEHDGVVTLECQYATALFDTSTVRRWLASYETLLGAAAAAPDCAVGALPVLTAEDRAAHANAVGETLPDVDIATVHGLVYAQAARTPDAVAAICGAQSITYAALVDRASRLARRLRASGAGPGARVGLCVGRGPDMLVGMLGILGAGAAYVPLDPSYPRERLDFMIDDAGIAVLVADAASPLDARHVVRLDDLHADAVAPTRPTGEAAGDDPAYVIYTSGSTGTPKGVVVPHRAAVNLLRSVARTPGIDASDVVLAVTTLSFDIAFAELIAPLTVGARVEIAPADVAVDGARLRALVEDAGVTLLDATPATYRLLIAAGWSGGAHVRAICTGEAMPRDLADALCARAGTVWNGYGPTETTVWSTFWRVEAPVTRVLIGRPVANTRALVLDARGQPVPIGVAGELYLAGAGVTLGYLGRPALTAERFVLAETLDPRPRGRDDRLMYRTGDRARLLADGALECLGRLDDQVKLRGYRIELGEIEHALAAHPNVREAAVAVREDRPGDARLVAYLVPREADAPRPDAEALGEHLRRTLPEFMLPRVVAWLTRLPLTPNGKVDRRALPAPDDLAPEAFVEPATDAERLVAALWSDALGVARIGAHDDFFVLGGHSLLAAHMLARLRRDHGVVLSFRTVFEAPTVARFALRVAECIVAPGESRDASPARRAIAPRTHAGVLSVGQERLLLLDELDPAQQPAQLHVACWRLRGTLDADAVGRAIGAIVERHELLRTAFPIVDGRRIAAVAPAGAVGLERCDRSHVAPSERDAALGGIVAAEQARGFDVGTAPLFRATLVRFADDEHVLLTLQHALVWDGWSLDVLATELSALYAADVDGAPTALAPLPATYGDVAAWQRTWLDGTEAAQQVAWWQTHLANAPAPLAMPTDRPGGAHGLRRGALVRLDLDAEETDALRRTARAHDATPFMLLLGAWSVLLHRLSGEADVVIGVPMRARTMPEMEGLIGPFVNTLPLRTRVAPDAPFASLLGDVRETVLGALAHQEVPVERLGVRPPALRALFSMQDARGRPRTLGAATMEELHPSLGHAATDLSLWMVETPDGLTAVLGYDTDLFDADTAQRLLDRLRTLLRAVRQAPDTPVAALELMAADERAIVDPAPAAVVAAPALRDVLRTALAGSTWPATVALGEAATTLAGTLPTGATVVVCTASPAARVVATVAAALGGAPLLVIDPDDGPAYVATVLGEVSQPIVVADADGAAVLPVDAAIVRVTADGAVVESVVPRGSLHGTPAADAPALVLHTPSAHGATVTAVSRTLLDARAAALCARLALDAHDVVVASATPDAASATLEVLVALSAGARLVVPEDGDGATLAHALGAQHATLGIATLDAWLGALDAGWRPGTGFRAVVADGPITPAAVAPLVDAGARAFAAWAPAGDTWAALRELPAAEVPDGRALLGAPLAGAHVLVVDDAGRPAPLGVPGAIRVDGRDSGAKGRRLADGAIEWLGVGTLRVDGTSAEPAAVAAALRIHPAIADAAVGAWADAAGRLQVVAHVVARDGAAWTDTELRRAVRDRLPARFAPRRIVTVDTLPADATQLPDPFAASRDADADAEPRTDAECRVAAVWRELLVVPRVRRSDNFFDLGGYSLLCFRAIDTLWRETGVRLSPRLLLVGTLAQAAREIDRGMAPTPAAVDVRPASEPRPGVLSRLRTLVGRGA